ncbi:MAG TPA: hypothetical protein VD906_15055 [Caulobacteraceae bacterium]|nr:hypothetical protein [Caulobacteraceae bacterium]
MKPLTILAAAGCLLTAGAAVAEDRRGGSSLPGPVYATQDMVQRPYGRPAIVGVMHRPQVASRSAGQSVLDCSTDARQAGELTVPYACVALPEWPSSGTPLSIEEETRRRFEGE